MFVVSEADAAAIRTAFAWRGVLSATIELRRLFPGITDTAQARESRVGGLYLCLRAGAGRTSHESLMPLVGEEKRSVRCHGRPALTVPRPSSSVHGVIMPSKI